MRSLRRQQDSHRGDDIGVPVRYCLRMAVGDRFAYSCVAADAIRSRMLKYLRGMRHRNDRPTKSLRWRARRAALTPARRWQSLWHRQCLARYRIIRHR